MSYQYCLNYIHNGFLTGTIFSLLFILHESYFLAFLLGIWTGILLTDKISNLSTIQQINQLLRLHKKANIIIRFMRIKTYRLLLRKWIVRQRHTRIIQIQKHIRRWLIQGGKSGFYPKQLEMCVKCQWHSYSQPYLIPNIQIDSHDIIQIDMDKYTGFEINDVIVTRNTKYWLVPAKHTKLSRFSVLLFLKSCRKKQCQCWKCRIYQKYHKEAGKYCFKHPETIKKIKKNDILLSYQIDKDTDTIQVVKWGCVYKNPHHPDLSSIRFTNE